MENFYGGYMKIECSDHVLAEKTGRTIAAVFSPKNKKNPLVVVGHDGGVSAGSIYDSVCRGISSAGVVAEKSGVLIPPVISCLTGLHDADSGIMITSSEDGKFCEIRLYAGGGHKLSHETWSEIKRIIFNAPEELEKRIRTRKGGVIIYENAVEEYIDFIKKSVGQSFQGMKIAIRCPDGNNDIAVKLFSELNAEVHIIPEDDIYFISAKSCHCGFIFGNNCECCTVIDENNVTLDSDRLSAVFAKFYKENNLLKNNTFVVTYGAGYGFMRFAEENNISVVMAGFDEKSVITKMLAGGYNYGTDNNGRIIFLDEMPAGDGFFTAVKLLSIMKRTRLPLSQLDDMKHYSQMMLDVDIPPEFREIWKNDCVITEHIANYIHLFGNRAKLSVHENPEKTSINITAEGMDYNDINEAVNSIAEKIRERIPERSINFENSTKLDRLQNY
ncbi:MAG: hypothetical protein NC205_01090 [Prevotella sp.]|nr:hypothetical protein [Alistipes senegalensis]MCM1357159.1 hypothetical protein [Prevotella sp.]MCM1472531.1 hypothetical protein [Muribaculaceae bacterium]